MLDMQARGLSALVRASVHVYNTEDEIEALVASIRQLNIGEIQPE